jgi:hypothetical protein
MHSQGMKQSKNYNRCVEEVVTVTGGATNVSEPKGTVEPSPATFTACTTAPGSSSMVLPSSFSAVRAVEAWPAESALSAWAALSAVPAKYHREAHEEDRGPPHPHHLAYRAPEHDLCTPLQCESLRPPGSCDVGGKGEEVALGLAYASSY